MPHSFIRIHLHIIFSTKDRAPIINAELEPFLHNLLKQKFEIQGCEVLEINGVEDHVHLLIKQNPKLLVSDILQIVKSGSAFETNKSSFINTHFEWQVGFGAFSVSFSAIPIVMTYIRNQKRYHLKHTYESEMAYLENLNEDMA